MTKTAAALKAAREEIADLKQAQTRLETEKAAAEQAVAAFRATTTESAETILDALQRLAKDGEASEELPRVLKAAWALRGGPPPS